MEEPSFDFLRTKKTLGYSVFPMVRCTYGIVGCSLTVRSQVDKFTAEQVFEAIEEFLVEFKQTLKSMKPAEFKGKLDNFRTFCIFKSDNFILHKST